MQLTLGVVSGRRAVGGPAGELLVGYMERASRYLAAGIRQFANEERLLETVDSWGGRTRPILLLADSRGEQMSSEELAAVLGAYIDGGAQMIVLAIGPADGWSAAARVRADKMVAFGRITLPHELAAVVAAEQLYRAMTIRAGHPYHSGH